MRFRYIVEVIDNVNECLNVIFNFIYYTQSEQSYVVIVVANSSDLKGNAMFVRSKSTPIFGVRVRYNLVGLNEGNVLRNIH